MTGRNPLCERLCHSDPGDVRGEGACVAALMDTEGIHSVGKPAGRRHRRNHMCEPHDTVINLMLALSLPARLGKTQFLPPILWVQAEPCVITRQQEFTLNRKMLW
ncbi:hypothetical protein MDA_GLEAN10023503 [Myotis davidii]|uniref:Uncharacterized protein n=1 Tax=Myotis davidii TaxID=225400 RepID=L5M1Y0_MYODS|nr:hypothetical protein MDA_GLEAN10023503 [Myotis davidii]